MQDAVNKIFKERVVAPFMRNVRLSHMAIIALKRFIQRISPLFIPIKPKQFH